MSDPTTQPPKTPTTEDRLATLEAKLAATASSTDADYYRVPKWMLAPALAIVVLTLVLALFTLPTSPFAQAPTPITAPVAAPAQAFVPQTPAPLGLTSATRTLGDPNAKLALVEYGDFQ